MDQGPTTPSPAARPLRAWPSGLLAVLYWAFQLLTAQLDMPMFSRFMSKALGNAAFLLVFLILWLTNGTVRGLTRLLGLGLLLGGATLGIVLADHSFDRFGFVMTSVPYVLTAWTAWMIVARLRPKFSCRVSLAGVILLTFGAFDFLRWEGLDGRLRASFGWRWAPTDEQAFLSAKASAPAAPGRPTRPWTFAPGDAAEFRGALRDGAVHGVRTGALWREAPAVLWKRKVGPGWSGMIVVDGFLVTQEQRGESEAIVCYDATTGDELWSHLDPVRFHEGLAGPGPRATPSFRDGRIYALGASGVLNCLDSATGKLVWSRNLTEETSSPPPMWGCSSSPLVVEGKVLVFIGGMKSRGLLALEAATGTTVWSCEGKESYSSAELLTIGGKPQVVMHDNRRLAGIALADGAVLWEKPGESESLIPMLQPHLLPDGTLLVATGQGLALLEVTLENAKWIVRERWESRRLKPSFNDFVVHEGYAYGLDDGVLCCVSLKDGERVFKRGRYGGGQIVLLPDPGLLIILSEMGELALVPALPQDPGDVARFPAIAGKTWNHPAVVRDRIYIRNGVEMACYRLPAP